MLALHRIFFFCIVLINQELNFFSVRFSLFMSVRFLSLITSTISSSPYLSFHFSILFLLCNNPLPHLLSSFFLCVLSSLFVFVYFVLLYLSLHYFCLLFLIFFCTAFYSFHFVRPPMYLCVLIFSFRCLFVRLFVRSSLPCSFLFFFPSLLS